VHRVPLRADDELMKLLHDGLPSSGMPAFPDIVDRQRANLISFYEPSSACTGHARMVTRAEALDRSHSKHNKTKSPGRESRSTECRVDVR
jgi:hypothetical protein